jgi:hypothetical protein
MRLGEIFGRSAGDACTELTLPRFLAPRGASRGVFRIPEEPLIAFRTGLAELMDDCGLTSAGKGNVVELFELSTAGVL